MNKRRLFIFRAMTMLYIIAVGFLLFSHMSNTPNVSPEIFGIPTDKVVHFIMFFPFPILVFYCYDRFTNKVWTALLMAVLTFIAGALFATGTEIIQGYLPYRSKDPLDLLADVTAMSISSIIVFAIDTIQIFKSRRHED